MAVDRSKKAAIEYHVVGPVAANVAKGNLTELADRIRLAGSNHVVVGGVALQHCMHGRNIVAGKAKVPTNIRISQRDLAVLQERVSAFVFFKRVMQAD